MSTRPNHASGLQWAECGGAGDYPVLEIDFIGQKHQKWSTVLFDTGARYNYLSDSFLERLGVPVPAKIYHAMTRDIGPVTSTLDDEQRARIVTHFREVELPVSVSANGDSFTGYATFRVVDDWEASTFASSCAVGECEGSSPRAPAPSSSYSCGYRVGLLSAGLLNDLSVVAEIDGPARRIRLRQHA